MANTARAGEADGGIFTDTAADFIGRTPLTHIPFRQWVEGGGGNPGLLDNVQFLTAGGTRTNTNAPTVVRVDDAWPGEDERRATTFSIDWHERCHIMPRTKIEFGNIITLEQADYELFNGYRNQSTTVTTITNNVAPGVSLPNMTPPVTRGPEASFLDPTSTTQSTSALGTMVKLKVNAEEDGLPVFDGTIDFLFSTGDELSLSLSGTRVVFIPMEYEAPVVEELGFLTEVIESIDGNEQRLSLRKQPRQTFKVEYALDGNDRQRMQGLLMDWMDQVFGFPLWHEKKRLAAAVSGGATVYQVNTTADVDFRVGGLAVVLSDSNTFDVINILSMTSTTITAADPSVNAYAAGATIMPLRLARIASVVSAKRAPKNLEVFRIEYEVTDNDTGTPAGSASGWNTYNGRVLLDDCNVMTGDMQEEYRRRIYVIDNQTGIVSQRSAWDRYKRSHQKGFVARNRADIIKLRKLVMHFHGRQKAWYIPTFFDDLQVKANLTIGTSVVDIENIEYTRFANARNPQRIFRIEFTDGTSLVRVIQSASQISATTERLVLDTTWPANRTVAEISRVMFYELVRFDTDVFSLVYPRIGLAEMYAPVRAVFDDN